MQNKNINLSKRQEALLEVESFLGENYQFRFNALSGKVESCGIGCGNSDGDDGIWTPVTVQMLNTIVRHAKKEGIGGDNSPRQDIEEFIYSRAVNSYDPVREYLDSLPEWDGRNSVADSDGKPSISCHGRD